VASIICIGQDVVTVPMGLSKITTLLPDGKFKDWITMAWMVAKGVMSFGGAAVDTSGPAAGLPLAADDDVIAFVDGDGADEFYVKAAIATEIQVVQFK